MQNFNSIYLPVLLWWFIDVHIWLSSDCDITVAQIQIQIQIQNNRAAVTYRCKSPFRKQMF